MKKATIENLAQVDALAKLYDEKNQPGTMIEIAIKTGADINERVKLPQIAAERTVIASRMINGLKVVHVAAIDWRILRGQIESGEIILKLTRQISDPKSNDNTSLAGSRSVAGAARSKRASPRVNGRPSPR